MMPFSLRYEINGRPFQEEQIKSIRHNVALAADGFSIPESIRNQKPDATPIASQWILRRVAGNVSYQDFGRAPNIEWIKLADGVHKVAGGSHATIVIEMRDHLVAVEGPLYEARTAPVIKSIRERFPAKPIRYVIPTHHHLDHSGGIRAFMAEGATIVVPFSALEFYRAVAKAPHTRQPDSLERNRRAVVIESFGGGARVLTDDSRRVEIHPMPTSHAEDIVVVYLPTDKMVIEADHISPRDGEVRPAPLVKEFVAGLDKLGHRRRHHRRHPRRQRRHAGGPRRCARRSALSRPSTFLSCNRVNEGMHVCDTKYLLVPSVIATLIVLQSATLDGASSCAAIAQDSPRRRSAPRVR